MTDSIEVSVDKLIENENENVGCRLPKSSKIGSHGFVIAELWMF